MRLVADALYDTTRRRHLIRSHKMKCVARSMAVLCVRNLQVSAMDYGIMNINKSMQDRGCLNTLVPPWIRHWAASRNEKATNPPEPQPQPMQSDVQTSNIHSSVSALQSESQQNPLESSVTSNSPGTISTVPVSPFFEN